MKKTIRLTESDLKRMVMETVKRTLNEAENNGWVVEDGDAQKAYNFACQQLGKETVDDAIIRCLGNERLAAILAYVFRMYDFREWEEYSGYDNEDDNSGEDVDVYNLYTR